MVYEPNQIEGLVAAYWVFDIFWSIGRHIIEYLHSKVKQKLVFSKYFMLVF